MKKLECNLGGLSFSASDSLVTARLEELEGVRALAALWVFGFHVWQFGGSPEWKVDWGGRLWDLFWFLKQGPSGVDLFMVLSGLCLFWPLVCDGRESSRWNWRRYLKRRVVRIVPPYYAAIAYAVLLPLILVWGFRVLGFDANSQPVPSMWQIGTHLAFIHTFFPETWDGITGAFWSMGLEAQFYLAFPVLVWAWRNYSWYALWGSVFVSILYRIGVEWTLPESAAETRFLLSITFLGRWMQFVAGMLVSASLVSRGSQARNRSGRSRMVLLCLGAALIFAGLDSALGKVRWVPIRDVLLSAGYAVVLFSVLAVPWRWTKVLSRGVLANLGVFSYSFFLIHQPTAWYIMEFVRKFVGIEGKWQVGIGLSAGLLITGILAWAFAWIFEGASIRARLGRGGRRVGNSIPAQHERRNLV